MAQLRIMPLASDGGINPKVYGVGRALNLQPHQLHTINAGWQHYKERTALARQAGRVALHCAVEELHNSMGAPFSGEVSSGGRGGGHVFSGAGACSAGDHQPMI